MRDDGQIKNSRAPFVESQAGRLHLRLEGQAHPTYHELGLDHTLLSRPLYPPHYPHITALRQELSEWAFFYFEPRERMRAKNPVKEARHIGLMGEDLAAFFVWSRVLCVRSKLRREPPRIPVVVSCSPSERLLALARNRPPLRKGIFAGVACRLPPEQASVRFEVFLRDLDPAIRSDLAAVLGQMFPWDHHFLAFGLAAEFLQRENGGNSKDRW